MVANRDSITKIGIPLCELIIAGEGASSRATELAVRLQAMMARTTTYHKQYDTHEERVLNRHLNLYRNKLKAAKSDRERTHWQEKIAEQRRKLAAFKGTALDLDGL